MQTRISEQYKHRPQGQEADRILRACVHCGFCTATCPTYQLLGDELDGPRGRIYLIKQLLEGNKVTRKTQQHLDRCLSCRSCETTCPSGVEYGRLVDIGRELVEEEVGRNTIDNIQRLILRKILPYPERLGLFLRLGQLLKPILPGFIKQKIPARQQSTPRPQLQHPRKMLILEGCVQSSATPATNAATARVLDHLGIQLISPGDAGCCGAASHHLSAPEEALTFMRRNIDAWWPSIEAGAEALIMTASGCGAVIKDYAYLLRHDADYADKAQRISELARDISEVLNAEDLDSLNLNNTAQKVSFHSPCTLQHGMKLDGVVENILTRAGFELLPVQDAHLCCGSAGTYSILQAEISQQLLDNKIHALEKKKPDVIATANIGCQLHLASQAHAPVKHWIELIDEGIQTA